MPANIFACLLHTEHKCHGRRPYLLVLTFNARINLLRAAPVLGNSAQAVVLTSQGMARSVSGARRALGRRRQKLCSHQTLGASHDFHDGTVQERNSLPLTRLVSRITVRSRLHLLRY